MKHKADEAQALVEIVHGWGTLETSQLTDVR